MRGLSGGGVRALIVGYGRAGKRHARLLARDGAIDGAAVVDPDAQRRAEARRDGFEAAADVETALGGAPPAFAVVATPPQAHVESAAAVVARGIPCLIEKPVGAPRQSLAPLHAAQRAGTLVSVVSQHRFAPDLPALEVSLRRANAARLVVRRNRSEAYLRRAGGDASGASGVAMTIGIHWLDILFSFFGTPRDVRLRASESRFGAQVRCAADIAWPAFELDFDAAWGEDVAERADELTGDGVRYREDCLHDEARRCRVDNEGLIAEQLRDVVACVRGRGAAPRVRLEDGEGALRIAERLA
jgi:predicted dehydrogenase